MEGEAAPVQTHPRDKSQRACCHIKKHVRPREMKCHPMALHLHSGRRTIFGPRALALKEVDQAQPAFAEAVCLTEGLGTWLQLDHYVGRQTIFKQKPLSDRSVPGPTCCCRSRMPDTRSWTRLETVQQCSPTTRLLATTAVLGKT